MTTTVVFLWISAAAVGLPGAALPGGPGAMPDAPGVAEPRRRDLRAGQVMPAWAGAELRDYGAARGLSFVPVSQARPPGLPANDAALVDALEGELEQARTALSALEEANASVRLHQVEAQLLAHPHLPQASFLMAECLALQAQAARAASPAQAAELEARRLALEGRRAAAFDEQASAPAAPSSVTLDVRGPGSTDELELDGVRHVGKPVRISLAPGLHHARVWRDDRLVYAAFVQISSEQTALVLDVARRTPCSAEDLARASRVVTDGRAAVPAGIACEHWARVREQGPGIAVALCERSRCGAFQYWQRRPPTPFTPLAVAPRGFPAWAGFVLAGGAAVVASSIVLWQSGAFERGQPSTATWQYGGVNPQGIRF